MPADQRVKLKECEPCMRKELWNVKLMIVPIIIGTLGRVPKNVAKRLEEMESL